METKFLKDIALISVALEGKVDVASIEYSQEIYEDYKGKDINHLKFIDKKFGLFFYTSASAIDALCYLKHQKLPVYVVTAHSNHLYEIK